MFWDPLDGEFDTGIVEKQLHVTDTLIFYSDFLAERFTACTDKKSVVGIVLYPCQ